MKVRICYLLLLLSAVVGNDDDYISHANANRKKVMKLTNIKTVLRDGYQLVNRDAMTSVHMYRGYRSVSVAFYTIGRDVTDAQFTFLALEVQYNLLGSCSPQEIIINLKRESYPAVNPDGFEFPKKYINPSEREPMHTIEMLSDFTYTIYSIKNPRPGNWYAIMYIKWENPNTQKVEQQGLSPSCHTFLYTDLQVKIANDTEMFDCYTSMSLSYSDLPVTVKCMTTDNVEPISLNLTVTNYPETYKEIVVKIQPDSIPTDGNNIIRCAFDPKLMPTQTIHFYPFPNAWHYMSIEHVTGNVSEYKDCESYYLRSDVDEVENHTIQTFMRDDKGIFFTYDYGLPTTDLRDATSLINITSCEVVTNRFRMNQVIDIGGNLIINVSLILGIKYYMGYVRDKNKGPIDFTDENPFFKVVMCLDLDHISIPQVDGTCKFNDIEKPALFVLNSTDSETIDDEVLVPFPESGDWYLSSRLFCDGSVCPCPTSDNGTKYYVVDKMMRNSDKYPHISWDKMREGQKSCNATILLSVMSTACRNLMCYNDGICRINPFGGLSLSFCECTGGYGGWDCSDDSRIDSILYMLAAVLLLTLSNLLFFLSIYVAIIRVYYTEAVMYTFTMVFSSFYHACDAPPQVSLCIVNHYLLQYGDFFCGIMSFWVTLLAVSILNESLKTSLLLSGAIFIALLTTWNMYSIVSFVVPVAVGAVVLLVSWYIDYHKYRKWRYPRSYYVKYMPIGLVLVLVGLICYAFFQTEQNYKLVHAFWHMIVAASVAFLLPDVRRGLNARPFMPTHNYLKDFPWCLRRSQPPAPAPAPVAPDTAE